MSIVKSNQQYKIKLAIALSTATCKKNTEQYKHVVFKLDLHIPKEK